MIYPITSKCNQNCIFCSAKGRNDKFKIEEFRSFLVEDQNNLIVLSGGEPFCLPFSKLISILKLAIEYGKKIELQTNASKIIKLAENQIKSIIFLINKNDGYFNVNLPSHISNIDYKITNLKNGFEKRIESIKLLKKFNATIRITHVINKINYKLLPNFANFLIKNSNLFNWVQFSFVKATGKAHNNRIVVPEYMEVSPYLIRAMEILDKNSFEFWVDHIPLCFLGKFYNRHVDVFKIKNKLSGDFLTEKGKIYKCKNCSLKRICSGPRIDYIRIYKTI